MTQYYRENKLYSLVSQTEKEVVLLEHRDDGNDIQWGVVPSVFRERYEPVADGVDINFLIEHHMEFDFGIALTVLKKGGRVARKGWNGKGVWIELQIPTELSKMTLPYIFMKTADDNLVPWLASQTDMLAEDFVVVG